MAAGQTLVDASREPQGRMDR